MTTARILFSGDWAYFEGMKFWHEDIRMLADMRRKGFRDGTLTGQALEDFVIQCLRTSDYRVLGLPLAAGEQVPADAAPAEH